MAGATLVISRVIMRGNENYRIRLNVQIAAIQEKRICIRVQFCFGYLRIATDVDRPAPIIVAEVVVHQFVDLNQLALNLNPG